jgi:hypothetical protein
VSVITAKVAAATFTIDGTDYAAQILNLTLTVEDTAGTEDRKTLDGSAIPSASSYTDRLTGQVVQDWPAPLGGLIGHSRIAANRGKVVPFVVTSVNPAGYSATGTVQMAPLDLTLDGNDTAESGIDWKILTIAETYPAGP